MTKTKICGISRFEDVKACNIHLPDYVGLVFCESARRVDLDSASEIAAKINRKCIKTAGVFRNNSLDEIIAAHNAVRLDVVQLHGDESAEIVKKLREFGDFEIIKALTISELENKSFNINVVDGVLIDGQNPGSGESLDWNYLAKILQNFNKPVWLAGGLNPQNVKQAIEIVKPAVVDVSSGVEVKRGVKSAELMAEFIEGVRR